MGSCERMLNKAMDNNIYIIIYTHTYAKAQHYCTIDVTMYVVHKKVIFAMSGGVDSTVAALMMKLSGYSVKGVYMHNWDETDESGYCNSEQDYTEVQDICKRLDIACSRVTFVKEYWNDVFRYFHCECDCH